MIQNNRDLAYFIARMGHEIRTPVNAIKGFGDVLLAEGFGSLNSKQKEYLGKMIVNSEKLLEVINQILDWAQLEAGQAVLHKEKINLKALILEIVSLMEIKVSEKKIKMEINANKAVEVEGDKTKLRQVLINLVSNALKFTPLQGKITLGFEETKGNRVVIFVKDTGIGIPQSQIDTLFEPFNQGPQLSSREKGSGLGLWICKSIVQLHQGKIWAKGQVDKGTTIFFEIPK